MIALGKQLRGLVETLSGVDVERHGSALTLSRRNRAGGAWFSARAQTRTLLDKLGVDVVLDVGANDGQFGERLRRSHYRGEIHSFEPVASAYAKLRAAAAGDGRWHTHNFALGSEDATRVINVSGNTVFNSLLKTNSYCANHFGDESVSTSEEPISVRRLDGFLAEHARTLRGHSIFLKMDTQGFDRHVFDGIGEWMGSIAMLQSEIFLIPIYEGMPHWTECIAHYERSGFGVVGMFPVNRDGSRVIEYDCLMEHLRPAAEVVAAAVVTMPALAAVNG